MIAENCDCAMSSSSQAPPQVFYVPQTAGIKGIHKSSQVQGQTKSQQHLDEQTGPGRQLGRTAQLLIPLYMLETCLGGHYTTNPASHAMQFLM